MRLSTRFNQLWKNDRGTIAALVAVFLTAFIGLMGAGIDLGLLYAARGEMQNAADSAAMAAAAELVKDLDGDSFIETNYGGSESTAHTYVNNNPLAKEMLMWSERDLFEAGKWDFTTKDFTSLGDTGNTDDLDAARVTLNRNVTTYFMRIFGMDTVGVQVISTGFLGCSGDGGKADVPIAINYDILKAGNPGDALILNSENFENIQWTTFDVWPSNTNSVKAFIEDPDSIPVMNIGDTMNLTNGTITPLLTAMENAYNLALGRGEVNAAGEWHVKLPVVEWTNPSVSGILRGFMHFKITEVITTGGDKCLRGYWADNGDMVDEGAGPGGECFGVRAGRPALIN